MCHQNSVHEALVNGDEYVAMCMCVDIEDADRQFFLHFINTDGKGEFVDNTLGRWSSQYIYYQVRFIEKKKFFNIIDIFLAERKRYRKLLPWYIRLVNWYQI